MGSLHHYWNIITTAFVLFPILAFVFTVPYLLYQYHRFGAIPLLRSVIIYSFILYCMTVYFLVILPLPTRAQVAQMTSPHYNLIPGKEFIAFWQRHQLDASQLQSYWRLLTSDVMREIFFNICLLFPLGVYLRYYFRCNIRKTLLIGFCTTLFLELTQLSGLYGIYPRPYRLFDTTDLLDNTLGTLIGYLCTPLLCFFLPTREQLDFLAYKNSRRVPLLRRLLAGIIDWLFIAAILLGCDRLIALLFHGAAHLYTIWPVPVLLAALAYFGVLQWACTGATPGKRLLRLRLVTARGDRPRLWQLLARYMLLYGLTLPSPLYCMFFFDASLAAQGVTLPFTGAALLFVVFMLIGFVFSAEIVAKLLGVNQEFFYGQITKTKIISTLTMPVAAAQHMHKD